MKLRDLLICLNESSYVAFKNKNNERMAIICFGYNCIESYTTKTFVFSIKHWIKAIRDYDVLDLHFDKNNICYITLDTTEERLGG